jgi:thymidine phosphorylase
LGRAAGNALEIAETVDGLQGRGPADLMDLTLELGAQMLLLARVASQREAALATLRRALASAAAWECFLRMVRLHGGDAGCLEDTRRLPAAALRRELPASRGGWVTRCDADRIGRACVVLGAGRKRVEDAIDPAVGITGIVKIGEPIAAGQPLMVLHANREDALAEALPLAQEAVTLGDEPPTLPALIVETLT